MAGSTSTRTRMSAEERRESVIQAAMIEFARTGYHGTSTEAIARRVGVSQPYLFRLFPGKRALFAAAADRCRARMAETFVDGLVPALWVGAAAVALASVAAFIVPRTFTRGTTAKDNGTGRPATVSAPPAEQARDAVPA